jgi:hypothetical protein
MKKCSKSKTMNVQLLIVGSVNVCVCQRSVHVAHTYEPTQCRSDFMSDDRRDSQYRVTNRMCGRSWFDRQYTLSHAVIQNWRKCRRN